MTFDQKWEKIHKAKQWGRYPREELIRWTARHYGQTPSNLRSGIKFLDLGCGQGASSWFLDREGYTVSAVDGSASAIKKLKQWLPLPDVHCCDFVKLPYPDRYFDGVVDIVSVAHNENCKEIYKEVARVLKVGGRLLSIVPQSTADRTVYQDKGATTFFTKEELLTMLNGNYRSAIGFSSFNDAGEKAVIQQWLVDALRIDPIKTKF